MIVNAHNLEVRVATINKWLENHPTTHFDYKQKEQNRDYYINKLCIIAILR